jgi:FemAB-related protein (PEP-CTERM system-associated)
MAIFTLALNLPMWAAMSASAQRAQVSNLVALPAESPVRALAIPAAAVVVRDLSQEDHAAWDRFVFDHPDGSPFHLIAWKKSIEQTFDYRSMYLVARSGDQIRGVLPLFLVNNFLTGKVLISSPFAVYGGILADSDKVRQALCERAREIGEELQVQHIEFRNGSENQCNDLLRIRRYVTFTQEIGPDESALLAEIPRKTRRIVRRACQNDLVMQREFDRFDNFEDLYSKNLRRLGTPSFPRQHFANILENFRGMVDIREVLHQGTVTATVLTFYFRDRILPYYGASDATYKALAPSTFMYYDLMRWGGRNGFRCFDFGRSKRVKGPYDFKSHWGMVESDLPYEVCLIKRKTMPNFSPSNPSFQLPIKCWRRLPLAVTRTLGPLLVRLVP